MLSRIYAKIKSSRIKSILQYSKGSENRFVVVQHFWCRKICKIVCRVPRKRVKSKFLYQDADVILLADKCIVVKSFVCKNYDKVLMETGKFSDNLRVTENGLVSGVDRTFMSSNSTFQNIGDRLNPLGKSADFDISLWWTRIIWKECKLLFSISYDIIAICDNRKQKEIY